MFLKVKNCISLDSFPILDIDYLAGEHEGAEAAGSTEPSKYCSASTRRVPDVARALWAWLVDGQLPEIPNVWVEEQGSPPHPLTRWVWAATSAQSKIPVPGAPPWGLCPICHFGRSGLRQKGIFHGGTLAALP